jgi:hypothetical protein
MKNKYFLMLSATIFLGISAGFSGEAFSTNSRTATIKDIEGPSKPGYAARIVNFFFGKCLIKTGETVDEIGDDLGAADEMIFNPAGNALTKKGEEIVESTLAKKDSTVVAEKNDSATQDTKENVTGEEPKVGGLTIEIITTPVSGGDNNNAI